MASLLQNPFLEPSKTTILVTGATGYIATHVVNEALKLGYKVRGTVRSEDKAAKTREIFGNNPNYTPVIVKDFAGPSSEIEDAVKGVDAIIHLASDTSFSTDPNVVIPSVVHGTEAFLKAAAKEKSVKRFVLCSSMSAAVLPNNDVKQVVTVDSFDEEAVDVAWRQKGESIGLSPYPMVVYAASKTEGERAFWKFIKDEKPGFVGSSVLPYFNIGTVLNGEGVTSKMLLDLYRDGSKALLPPQWYIDVVDDARLHLVAAVLDDKVENERIFAAADRFNWNSMIDAIKKARPDHPAKLVKDPNEKDDLSELPNQRGAELLKKWYGQDGYKSLEQSVAENLVGY